MKIVATKIDDFDLTIRNRFISSISTERRSRLEKYRSVNDQIRSIVSELLLRKSVIDYWGIENKYISFYYNEYGKPFFQNYPDFHFNLSHSGEWVTIALDHFPIGVDIEHIVPIDLKLAHHFFSPSEIYQLEKQPIQNRLSYFYKIWTLKESFIKGVGKGFFLSPETFSFDLKLEKIDRHPKNIDTTYWTFKHFFLDSNYVLAIASYNRRPKSIEIISFQKLIKEIDL
ncbi:4'-phosphopantetheinyl transferase [Gracilibacillus orientalis]|uniref:4'-phosphopantetheinyl transferase n=1 Tax=Gracilibacillus orientalis TaxID=334253 RepID=A0A1I4PU85_9BACI|nr:4'-phosphopantetheinyl transferase superfamily protein [Gracilibacillus orientalis]SFM31033.1 4'-phosphopantetheinyl transferase [Gracilibacillus orientalis]